MSQIFFKVMYIIFLLILLAYEIVYFRLKFFKKDKRLKGVSFLSFLWNTRTILNKDIEDD